MLSTGTSSRLADGDHVVQFYDRDEYLVELVSNYLTASVLEGDAVIVIAVPAHCDMFRDALVAAGVDVAAAEADGTLSIIDAVEVASSLMTEGRLDFETFEGVVARPVRQAGEGGRPVRIYGEIVAVLWEGGNVPAAIELESRWNQLSAQIPFALFCAYPSKIVSGPGIADSFAEVCLLHSEVFAGAPDPMRAEAMQNFDGTHQGPRLARSFVTDILQQWDQPDLVDHGAIVVSELATNAVVHADSDFTVGLSRRDGNIRVEVTDSSFDAPQLREPDRSATSGRGLVLVDAIASRWGHALVAGGKVVWAEIRHHDVDRAKGPVTWTKS